MNTCLKISKDADPSKLQSDIMILFERDTWRSNVDRYYEFDQNVFLLESPELNEEETVMRNTFKKVTKAIQVK